MVKRMNTFFLSLYFGLFLLLGIGNPAFAQSRETNKLIKKGNDFYNNKKFNDAEVEYRKALEKNKSSFAGKFNLADALYKQGKFEDAAKIFKELSNSTQNKEELAKVNYNLGNSYLKQEKYRESVESYKKALKLNPKDEDARYNLAYALKMIQKQQQNQQNQDQQNKDQQKQNQQNQNQQNQDQQNKNQENKDQEQQNQQNQQQQNQENKSQKQNSNQLSEEQAKQMLEAIGQNEKEAKDKLKKVPIRAKSGKPSKDW